MRLSLILESPQQQADRLAQRLGLSAEEVVLQCNQVSKKYWKWVLQQWYSNKIDLPEDSAIITDVLGRFDIVSRTLLPSQKDINQYQSLEEIQKVVNDFEGVQASSKTHDLSKFIGLDGVKVVHEDGPYVTLEIASVKALKKLGEGTKWCTKGSYRDNFAEDYIDRYEQVYTIFQNGRPVLQYTPNYAEVKDIFDKDARSKRLLSLIPAPDFSDVKACYYFAKNVVRGRWPEAEPYIMKDPGLASDYARYVIKGRWPEAEPYIMEDLATPESYSAFYYVNEIIKVRWPEAEPYIAKDPANSYKYAMDIIKGRWPKGEPSIMQQPYCAYVYARDIIKGRWAKAEPYMIKDPEIAYRYAKEVIKGRWAKAEPYMIKDPEIAYKYARDIIKGRWPIAEPYMIKNPGIAFKYARDIIKGRWPEAEPYIIKSMTVPSSINYAIPYARSVIKGDWPEAGITL